MLYGIFWIDTDELLSPASFKEHWQGYGNNQLHGWRPPKKVYYTLGNAKSGFAHIPDQIKPHVCIRAIEPTNVIIDGEDLIKEQKERQDKRREEPEERYRKWRTE